MRLQTVVLAGMLLLGCPAFADGEEPLANWTSPPYWTLPAAKQARTALAVSTPLPLIALPPCRIVDTRGNAPLTGGFLPPATVRSYTVTNVCGIPPGAQALSLNATVVHPTGQGFLVLYPEGGTFPPVSTLNFLGNDVIVNAAVVPLSGTGGISMALGVSGGDVILDTNGYYAPQTVVSTLNGVSGDVTLAAGANVTLTPSGSTLTIAATGGSGGGPPTGPAGGSLSGTYPNPGIAASAVGSSHLASGAVTDAKITGPIAFGKVGGSANGAILFGSASGALSQDLANFFWDSTNHRLGIGTTTPSQQLELTGMMKVSDTAATSGTPTAGVLFVGADRFLHNYAKPGSGAPSGPGSTFVGQRAGNFTMGGANANEGSWNTGVGAESLRSNTTGYGNTAVGYWSLQSNTEGASNSALGIKSLYSNTKGFYNTAVGETAMSLNTTASSNTAIGAGALALQSYSNGGAIWVSGNTAVGASALVYNNPTTSGNGIQNTAVGTEALAWNLVGFQNTALGWHAGYRSGSGTGYGGTITYVASIYGNKNTFIGHGTGTTANNLFNCTAVGIDAYCDDNDQVRLGNPFVGSIGGKVGWSALSDVRAKRDIRDVSLGLDFVLSLRPVEYRMRLGNSRVDLGFLAQDVERLLGEDYNVVTVGGDPQRTLSLRYTDLIAPIVKAIQEQQVMHQAQQTMHQEQLEARDARIAQLERRLAVLEEHVTPAGSRR
ncbi:MAG: tail fiber domain-containing protein [Thermoanaerobaculia bacterium]|nr:tail fiber domain-containing protein [Thermoanaerobaculia bacterium]